MGPVESSKVTDGWYEETDSGVFDVKQLTAKLTSKLLITQFPTVRIHLCVIKEKHKLQNHLLSVDRALIAQ